jgi:hypothetical protein
MVENLAFQRRYSKFPIIFLHSVQEETDIDFNVRCLEVPKKVSIHVLSKRFPLWMLFKNSMYLLTYHMYNFLYIHTYCTYGQIPT